MKQIEFKTSKGEFLAIELNPEKYYLPQTGQSYLVTEDTEELFALKPGHWEYLFNVSLCTEEQAKEVVDESVHTGLFAHYVHGINPPNLYHYKNAIPSLLSLLEANGVVFENPTKHPRDMQYKPASFGWYKDAVKAHEEAQSKVFNKTQTYLFKKI